MTLAGGGALSLARLAECLDEYGVPAMPEDTERLDAVHSDAGSWAYAGRTCGYASTMVTGWAKDKSTERHPWLVSQSIRLVAAHRAGCLTADDHAAARLVIEERFRTRLRVGRKRPEHRGEITGALTWGVQRVSTFATDRVLRELRGHVHDVHRGEEPLPKMPPVDISAVHAVFTRSRHHRAPMAWLRRSPPTRRAISAFGRPSAASSTIRARAANPAGADQDRTSPVNRAESPERKPGQQQQTCPIAPSPDRKVTYNTRH